MTDENALLLAAARVDEGAAPRAAGALDGEYLLEAAHQQGMAPLLYDWLQRQPGVHVPELVRLRLHDTYWSGHFRNRLLLGELRRLIAAAAEAGIDMVPLKGAHLAPLVYPSPALRPLSDLDLLVRPRDVGAFGQLLAASGYAEVDHAPSYVADDELAHESRDYCWFAAREGFDALVEYRVTPLEVAVGRLTDLDESFTAALGEHTAVVWERSAPHEDGGRRLSPEDVLLQVTTHLAAKHVDFRLIWLHDIARIVLAHPAVDWAYVAERAASLRVEAPVVAALEAARSLTGAPITDAQLALVAGTVPRASRLSLARHDLARLRALVARLPARDLRVSGPGHWPLGAALSRVRGWRARLRVMRWVALPGREYLQHRGVDGRGALGRAGGSLRRLATRLRRGSQAGTR